VGSLAYSDAGLSSLFVPLAGVMNSLVNIVIRLDDPGFEGADSPLLQNV